MNPGVRRSRDLFMKALHQPRLADARLADDQRRLAFPGQGSLHRFISRRSSSSRPTNGVNPRTAAVASEPPARSARLNYPVKLDRLSDALEHSRPEIFHHEHSRLSADGVAAVICTAPGSAAVSTRAAIFAASPKTSTSPLAPLPTTTGPESNPLAR